MNNHTDLLNYLATTFNLQSYLEIGVQDPRNNFDLIKCERKTGVDPNTLDASYYLTSDKFFELLFKGKATYNLQPLKPKFDLVFIDGLHHADQVKRDFENSLKCLTDNGFIVIHDTLPTEEKYTHVPRDSKIWFGDVYKFVGSLMTYEDLMYVTLGIDCGCTVVWRTTYKTEDKMKIFEGHPSQISNWEEFTKYNYLINATSLKEFYKQINELKFYRKQLFIK